MDETILIREAVTSDREPVFEFVSKTWEWGDYIPQVWDKWLSDPNGRIFVAELEGKPVAMNHARLIDQRTAWLEGARVHSEHRGKGIATALAHHAMQYAASKGIRIVRLATSQRNLAARAHLRKLGMRKVAEFSIFEGIPKEYSGTLSIHTGRSSDYRTLWLRIAKSKIFRASGGLFGRSWTWYELTKDLLKTHLDGNNVLVARLGNRFSGLALVNPADHEPEAEGILELGYLDGNSEAIAALAWKADLIRRQFGNESVRITVPNIPRLAPIMEAIGVRREHIMLIFAAEI